MEINFDSYVQAYHETEQQVKAIREILKGLNLKLPPPPVTSGVYGYYDNSKLSIDFQFGKVTLEYGDILSSKELDITGWKEFTAEKVIESGILPKLKTEEEVRQERLSIYRKELSVLQDNITKMESGLNIPDHLMHIDTSRLDLTKLEKLC